jgi:hypothetical protein
VGDIEEEHLINTIFLFLEHNWSFFSNYHKLTQQRAEEAFAFDDTLLFLREKGWWRIN